MVSRLEQRECLPVKEDRDRGLGRVMALFVYQMMEAEQGGIFE
jgi:hypothetical protein